MAAHGAISVAARARCVAGRHAAQAGRSLGWIGGEELLGTGIELVECLQAYSVPVLCGNGFVGEVLAQLGKDHSGLYTQVEHAFFVAAKAQIRASSREVHDMAASGNGATGESGAAALHGDGRAGGIQLAQDGANLVLARGERDGLRRSDTARFVAQVFFKFRAKRFDLGHMDLPLCLDERQS